MLKYTNKRTNILMLFVFMFVMQIANIIHVIYCHE